MLPLQLEKLLTHEYELQISSMVFMPPVFSFTSDDCVMNNISDGCFDTSFHIDVCRVTILFQFHGDSLVSNISVEPE